MDNLNPPFAVCDLCEAFFTDLFLLQLHAQTHHLQWEFTCPQCMVACTDGWSLAIHECGWPDNLLYWPVPEVLLGFLPDNLPPMIMNLQLPVMEIEGGGVIWQPEQQEEEVPWQQEEEEPWENQQEEELPWENQQHGDPEEAIVEMGQIVHILVPEIEVLPVFDIFLSDNDNEDDREMTSSFDASKNESPKKEHQQFEQTFIVNQDAVDSSNHSSFLFLLVGIG